MFINVGASDREGNRIRTKKALIEALAIDVESVEFDVTSLFHLGGLSVMTADEIRPGDTLTVVGPDPFTKRSWYASVTRSTDGKVRVS